MGGTPAWTAGLLHTVECKSGTTCASDWMDAAHRWRVAAGAEAAGTTLVYGGEDSFEREDHRVISWRAVGVNA